MKKLFLLVLMFFTVFTITGQTINMLKLTLNDSVLSELNIDKLTDLLGRPDLVTGANDNLIGPSISYAEKGISFLFEPKFLDPNQGVSIVTLFISKVWDTSSHEWFYPFPVKGITIPNVNSSMKIKEIVPLFGEVDVSVFTADQLMEEAGKKKSRHSKGSDPSDFPFDEVHIKLPENLGMIYLKFDKTTKYLERINLFSFPKILKNK